MSKTTRTVLSVLFIIAISVMSTALILSRGDLRFFTVLKVNPKSDELVKAFELYTRETGKTPNDMTYEDIAVYVERVRK